MNVLLPAPLSPTSPTICPAWRSIDTPASALEFDYSCPGEARVRAEVSALFIEVPPDPTRSWAVAVNPDVLGTIDCSGATARIADAHLFVHPEGGPTAWCRARYLDSGIALRRMLKK